MDYQENLLLMPAEAMKRLDVADSTLRNYAKAYEAVFGPLGRGSRNERLWPIEAVERLSAAKALVDEGVAASIEAALGLQAGGEVSTSEVLSHATNPSFEEAVVARLETLTEEIRTLRQENSEVRQQLKALEAPKEDKDELADLRRRNKYLNEELERKNEELEQRATRRWWKLWGR